MTGAIAVIDQDAVAGNPSYFTRKKPVASHFFVVSDMDTESATFHLLVIKTNQLREQLAFYTALGLSFEHHRHENGPSHYATAGHPVIELYPLPKGVTVPDTTTRIGFTVTALDSLIERLRGGEIQIISEPAVTEWGYTAIVKDVDGRTVELVQAM
jgi:lactoylglutathione lyase